MKFDLLLRGGTVIDPGCGLNGLFDVGVAGGRIVEISAGLDETSARKTIDVRDKIVTPGLVDLHAHIFVNCCDMGERTDDICRASGVTTICDGGSAGSANFDGFRHLLNSSVQTKTRAFVNLSAIGLIAVDRTGELTSSAYSDPEGCARIISENSDLAIGVKLRFSHNVVWEYTTEPLRQARRAADMAGARLMIHVTDSPLPLPEILAFMKPGDIITHCLHGYDNEIMGPGKTSVLKEVRDAQKHGIIFDCAHGRFGHFNFPILQRALDQGFIPDTISTDLSYNSATSGPVYDLPTTMSKLLHFGVPLEDVIRRATVIPGRILATNDGCGTLQPGTSADIAVFDLKEGLFELRDTDGNTVQASRILETNLTLKDGRIWFEREAG